MVECMDPACDPECPDLSSYVSWSIVTDGHVDPDSESYVAICSHSFIWESLVAVVVETDGTYTHNIENFVHQVCKLARVHGDEHHESRVRASSLQCVSAMIRIVS
ncbi:hypothetical protein GH714_006216 [Hevea brasiliensis]|uniref:Uncharacterized protein n=1 Tax=Hevea brasiliensis TaxID=3981 RepID=A0A6A6NFW1_HEVBR|nr:hypothetical protein GH714_006216 [Hevea brasiliensis]